MSPSPRISSYGQSPESFFPNDPRNTFVSVGAALGCTIVGDAVTGEALGLDVGDKLGAVVIGEEVGWDVVGDVLGAAVYGAALG